MNEETALVKFTTTLTAKDVFCGNAASVVDAIKKEALSYVNDPATPAGRKAIISLAAKVAKSKTYLDDLGKDLTEEWRTQTNKVNEERKLIRTELDTLRDTIRQPVTEYEQRETQRVIALRQKVEKIRGMIAESHLLTTEQISERIAQLEAINVTSEEYQEYAQQATNEVFNSLNALKVQYQKTLAYEQQQIEIARLRKEAEDKAQADREAEIARQATLKAEAEAKRREEEIIRKANEAKLAAERAAEEAKLAAQRAEAKAKADALAAEAAAKQREAAAVAKAKADADAAHKAELDRVARIEAELKRKRIDEQAAEAKRKADAAHINNIKKAALESCVAEGFTRDDAVRFLKAVTDGKIAHVSINY